MDDVLREQIDYYRERAPEYDEWFERRGMYDLGTEWNTRWDDEVREVEQALAAFAPRGRVLELASGTGWWTERLARHASSLTCVDASAETIELARARVPDAEFVQADLFAWEPDDRYDVVFFSFWLSHVPAERFESFWELVGRALVDGGRVFFIDNLKNPSAAAGKLRRFLQRDTAADGVIVRRLNDGREFRAVKIYYDPDDLRQRLARIDWRFDIRTTEWSFYYGIGGRDG
jgi:ubiquinone/menaquinone biosynthesis C-methylase UbiE